MNFVKCAAVAVAFAFAATAAVAQTTPTAPVAPKAPAATTPAPTAPTATTNPAQKKAMTPEAQACSTEADAKNLHGKERVKFRKACIKAKMAPAAPKTDPVPKKS